MATVIEGLLPVIDAARQVATDLGARPYRVLIRTSSWDGGAPYVGNRTDEDTELLPRPRVAEVSGDGAVFSRTPFEGGSVTSGRLRIHGISPLTGLGVLNPPVLPHQRGYVVVLPADGAELSETIYTIDSGPFRHLTKWSIEVVKVES